MLGENETDRRSLSSANPDKRDQGGYLIVNITTIMETLP